MVIDNLRRKLEQKDFNAAELYYNLGHYKASGVAFKSLMRAYPDSEKSDNYKFMAIKAYYQYARNSVHYRQKERYETVVNEYLEFNDRYPSSKLRGDAEKYYTLAKNNIKTLENEQNKTESVQ